MKLGIFGSGTVAQTLAAGFIKHGHEVMLGTRTKATLAEWSAKNPKAKIGSSEDVAKFGEVLVLAVKGSAAAEPLRSAGSINLVGKTIIDTTNPIADGPPVKGVLPYFTAQNESLMEQLQKEFAQSRFVKAFNSVGAPQMVNPEFKGGKPTMFICSNFPGAKKTVNEICGQFGWETYDMGTAEAARAIEPLCMLWCIPGLARKDWSPRAFKLLL